MAKPSVKQDELSEEMRQLILLQKARRESILESLSKLVAEKRDEAVAGRKESGIERIWTEDREYYLGIDDANRASNPYTKSMNTSGGLSANSRSDIKGATAFFNITRQFVDSASARMGDILLPAGDWNFSLKPTPVPELDKIKRSTQPVVDAMGNTLQNPDGSPYTLGQFSAEETKDANDKAEKAEKRVRDWLTECQYHAEVRKVIENAAQIGSGVIRGAYPAKKKLRVVLDGKLIVTEETVPTSKSVDPFNAFPDPNCGDNIQNGGYFIERDYLSARQVRQLKGSNGYINSAIDKILKEGPKKSNLDVDGSYKRETGAKDEERFEVWYFFGDLNLDELEALTDKAVPESVKERDAVPAVVVMINDTAIRGFLNPLDNGEFPYDIMPWQRMADSPWGVGVARQGRVPQDMLNASARTLMNNMGLSAAPQIIIRQSAIRPVDGDWELVGGKFWYATEEADVRSVQDAFISIIIPSMQKELEANIQMSYKMMEDATGVSFLLQGQQGSAPDTVGGMQLIHKNSSALLRRIARVFDECVTEPHIRRYYDWLLLHGEDDEKGDLKIQAIGSSALVEREIQAEQAVQLINMSANPAFEMSPKRARDELLRAWRFEPSKFDLSEEEKQKMSQQAPPPIPQVEVAKIRAETDMQIEQMRQEANVQKMQIDTDRDFQYTESLSNRDSMTLASKREELSMKRELALLEYSAKHNIKLEEIKSQLAKTAMTLRVQKELAHLSGGSAQVATPAVEPQGKAPNGEAFTK